jgi:hypothetical protein
MNSDGIRLTETTGLHHPSVPETSWREWLNEKDCFLLVTACCNAGHHVPLWAFRNYGTKILERRCNNCGALVMMKPPAPMSEVVEPQQLTFQVHMVDNATSGSYTYFTATDHTDIATLKQMAAKAVQDDWKKVLDGPKKWFGEHKPCRPIVHVAQYANGKRVGGGVCFSVKWR